MTRKSRIPSKNDFGRWSGRYAMRVYKNWSLGFKNVMTSMVIM
jgi:hypothetical protein